MNDGGGDGAGCFDIKEWADTTELTNVERELLWYSNGTDNYGVILLSVVARPSESCCCSHSILMIFNIIHLLRMLIIILIVMSKEVKQRASSIIRRSGSRSH